jgi:KTSC domain
MTTVRKELNSSAIAFAEYDDETETLSITFRSGQTYDLNGVPEDIAQGLFDSSSPGTYWHTVLKDNY